MISHFVLPIRFGQSTRRELRARPEQALFQAGQVFFGSQGEQVSLPIEWISSNFRMARAAMAELLTQAIPQIDDCQNLLIDLGGPSFLDPIDPELYFGLADFCETEIASRFENILAVCPGRVLDKSPEAAAIKSIQSATNATIVFVDDDEIIVPFQPKQQKSGDRKNSEELIHNFLARYLSQKVDITSEYKATVVRMPGLFQGQSDGEKFAFTFDFSRGDELAQQLCERKISFCEDHGIETIFYVADREWFSSMILDAKVMSSTTIKFIPVLRNEQIDLTSLGSTRYSIFCPVVRSGGQFVSLLEGASTLPEFIWCLGSIDEGSCAYVDENVRKLLLRFADQTHCNLDLHFESGVEAAAPTVQRLWDELQVDIGILKKSGAKYQVSAPEAWAMMIESGFAPESYGPNRKFLPAVPKFTSLVPNNFGFLTLALREKLRISMSKTLSESDLILCVDEKAAVELSHKIVGAAYERSIAVSRQLLKEIEDSEKDANSLLRLVEKHKDEIDQLRQKVSYARHVAGLTGSRKMHAVIVDELIVTGSTFRSLDVLSDQLDLDVIVGVAILKVTDADIGARFPVFPLYEIPAPSHLSYGT